MITNGKLLDVKDTPVYWLKQLMNTILIELELTDKFVIIDPEAVRVEDSHMIIIDTDASYDFQVLNSSFETISNGVVFKIKTQCAQSNTDSFQDYQSLSIKLNQTIDDAINARSFPSYNLYHINRTSTNVKRGVDKNRNAIYESRYNAWFQKNKEI